MAAYLRRIEACAASGWSGLMRIMPASLRAWAMSQAACTRLTVHGHAESLLDAQPAPSFLAGGPATRPCPF
jgi:hypothetical protein